MSNDRMITFTRDDKRFNLRIAGVAIEGGRVLLHQFEGDDFWALPGGRGELLETAHETLRREMQEELGIEVTIVRLLWMVENFFEYQGLHFHEIGLYFLMQAPPDWPLRTFRSSFSGYEGHLRLTFRWFPLEEVERIVLLPSFLTSALRNLPDNMQHIVHFDM